VAFCLVIVSLVSPTLFNFWAFLPCWFRGFLGQFPYSLCIQFLRSLYGFYFCFIDCGRVDLTSLSGYINRSTQVDRFKHLPIIFINLHMFFLLNWIGFELALCGGARPGPSILFVTVFPERRLRLVNRYLRSPWWDERLFQECLNDGRTLESCICTIVHRIN